MAKTKVFILEDENIVAKDIEQSLKKLGYDVVGIASSGEKVIEILKKGTLPEIFLMDIMIFYTTIDGFQNEGAKVWTVFDCHDLGIRQPARRIYRVVARRAENAHEPLSRI